MSYLPGKGVTVIKGPYKVLHGYVVRSYKLGKHLRYEVFVYSLDRVITAPSRAVFRSSAYDLEALRGSYPGQDSVLSELRARGLKELFKPKNFGYRSFRLVNLVAEELLLDPEFVGKSGKILNYDQLQSSIVGLVLEQNK